MDATRDGPPVVAVPGRLDRRLRLGPFSSGRDALKFLAYAAVGVAFAPTPAPALAVPFVLVGAVVTLYKPGGEALDARLAVVVRFFWRHVTEPRDTTARSFRHGLRSATVAGEGGSFSAVLCTGGAPLAFLPPEELARRFELFRDLLRSAEGELRFLATVAPIHRRALVPGPGATTDVTAHARAGYTELVEILCRRRSVRQVYVGLTLYGRGPDVAGRLDVAADALADRIEALGLRVERLHGRTLWASAVRLGLRTSRRAG